MGSASKILYTVGKVVNIIEIVMTSLMLLLGLVVMIFGETVAANIEALSGMLTMASGTGFTIGGAVALVISIVTLVLANNATRALDNGVKENAPHIVMIVIGVLGDIFYLLGGIFGLVAENTESSYSR
ncbi:MAG: hypothetical protein J5762_03560 [Clostridia bacterium]|nr:hypothetical protein [Clostridia bacterium]